MRTILLCAVVVLAAGCATERKRTVITGGDCTVRVDQLGYACNLNIAGKGVEPTTVEVACGKTATACDTEFTCTCPAK